MKTKTNRLITKTIREKFASNSRNSDIAIQLTNVSKQYIIHHEKSTLVEKFIKGKDEEFTALKDINLTIKKGERVGIIGSNGSGKTTLLKIIAGVTTPTNGEVIIKGKIGAIIDIDSTIHPDLTGIQNIYLNGVFFGLSKKEVTKKVKSIIRFSGIDQYIDVPSFTYSQGMKLRLGLAIAIECGSDILLLDENFISGDPQFQKQMINTLLSITNKNITTIMCSHVPIYTWGLSKQYYELNKGEITNITPAEFKKNILENDKFLVNTLNLNFLRKI